MYSRSTGYLLLSRLTVAFYVQLYLTSADADVDWSLLMARIISTPLGRSNTNVRLNRPQAREIKDVRLITGRFGVLTGKGVAVKIRAVLRSP
jgi:hypothetical protein